MARARTPVEKAKLTGTYKHNPDVFKPREEAEGKIDAAEPGTLGEPPAELKAAEKKVWRKFISEWPWLTWNDRVAIIPLIQMRVMIEDRKIPKTAAMYANYRMLLNDFGGTPAHRSKVFIPPSRDPEEDDPFAGFGSGGKA